MRKVERLIIYTLLAVLALATFSNRGLIQAKDKPGEGTFTKISIVDGEGRARIILGKMEYIDFKNQFGLRILDEKRKRRTELSNDSTLGTAFAFYDENGRERVLLGSTPLGQGFSLRDEKGKERATLNLTSSGHGLVLADEKGKERAALGLTPWGPRLVVIDENGKLRIALGTTEGKPSSLELFDKEGKVIWQTPQD